MKHFATFEQAWAWLEHQLTDRTPREAAQTVRAIKEDLFQEKSGQDIPSDEEIVLLESILERLLAGEPVQYVTGWAPFYGYMFEVNPSVLIPRPETEELIYEILHHAAFAENTTRMVLDVGTGSGCIAVSLAKQRPQWDVHAIDISNDALRVARRNARRLGVQVAFRQMDLRDQPAWDELSNFDLIVSNPPYVAHDECELLSSSVKDFEPPMALFAPPGDPLFFYKLLAALAQSKLVPHGWLFVELNALRAQPIAALFAQAPWQHVEIIEDLQGRPRILAVQKGLD